MVLGTNAFLSFTPTYDCWSSDMDCGKGPTTGQPFTLCQPQMVGTVPAGTYNVVYVVYVG